MCRNCTTSKELGEAIKNNEETILIEGDLKNQVLRIRATGKVAWAVCVVALGTAIAASIAAFKIEKPAAALAATTVAAGVLGPAVVPAVAIGVAAGGVGALITLRDDYKIVEKDDKHIKLQRKH